MSLPSFQSRHPVPPNPEPSRHPEPLKVTIALLITTGMFAGGIAIGWNSYSRHQQTQQAQLEQSQKMVLKQAKAFYEQNDPQACVTVLDQAFTQSLITIAQSQRQQCQRASDRIHLNRARQLAHQSSYRAAIEVAKQATQGDSAQEASTLIQQWSWQILRIAEQHYHDSHSGKYELAIHYARSLRGTPLEAEAQAKLQTWERTWKQESDRFDTLQQHLNDGELSLAKAALQQIRHPFWRSKSVALWQTMQQYAKTPSQVPQVEPNPAIEAPLSTQQSVIWGAVLLLGLFLLFQLD